MTDILREWGGSTTRSSLRGSKQAQLCRRETLADLAKSLPWGRGTTTESSSVKKRRESSADSGIKSVSTKRRDSSTTAISDFRSDIARLWGSRRESTIENGNLSRSDTIRRGSGESGKSPRNSNANSRRGSGESGKNRRDSMTSSSITTPPKFQKQHSCRHHKRKASKAEFEAKYYRAEQRPSTSSTASDSASAPTTTTDTSPQILPPPTIITSSVTSQSISPKAVSPVLPSITPPPSDRQISSAATSPVRASPTSLFSTRRDSTTQVYHKNRRDSRSPDGRARDPKKFPKLPRQSTAIDESLPPPASRRESQPTLSLDPSGEDSSGRKARRDSLSPDSASCGQSRRESRSRLSPDRSAERDISPVARTRRGIFFFKNSKNLMNIIFKIKKKKQLFVICITRKIKKTIHFNCRRVQNYRHKYPAFEIPR